MKQKITTATHPIQARITIPGSKSITNRALLLAALAEGISELSDILLSEDTITLIHALRELGIVIQLDEASRSCIVGGCGGRFPKLQTKIWCENAGTVARFLLAMCAAMPGEFSFDATPQLRARPIAELLRVLCLQGAAVQPDDAEAMPFLLKGTDGLIGGEIEMNGSESGQFVSAMLMAAPFSQTAVLLEVHDLVSRSFVEMTCVMMAEFGVLVRRMHQERFSVPVPQRYKARDYVVEPDLSTASYFFAAAAVTAGQVTIQPVVVKQSKQGDAKFLSILEKMGCRMLETQVGLTIKGPTELRGVSVDMRDCSDTFMTLAAIAPFAKTPTTITNIGHTRLQESDRISVMRSELQKLGIKAEEGPDWLKIYPADKPKGGEIDPHQDHRIAMAFSVVGLKVQGVEIANAECVGKTCPEFFELWSQLNSGS